MNTKVGEAIPQALVATPGMQEAWAKLRPSCQRDYAELVASAKTEATRQRRLQRVLKLTQEYAESHPHKRKGHDASTP